MDRTQFQLFHPSVEDMARAEKLFHSSPTHKIDYYTSAERMDHVPALKAPEVSGTISSPSLFSFVEKYMFVAPSKTMNF